MSSGCCLQLRTTVYWRQLSLARAPREIDDTVTQAVKLLSSQEQLRLPARCAQSAPCTSPVAAEQPQAPLAACAAETWPREIETSAYAAMYIHCRAGHCIRMDAQARGDCQESRIVKFFFEKDPNILTSWKTSHLERRVYLHGLAGRAMPP